MGTFSISSSILSVLLVISVLWNPAFSDDSCSIGCKGSSQGPSFLSNHKYNYAVEGEVGVYVTGAEGQETSVKLNAQVSVAAQGNCGYVLRVQSVQITGPGGKKYNKPPGIDKPVRFTLQDGHIGSEICTETGDTRRSLNIKRAIISLLQSPVKQSTETDVFGICPTEVSSSEEGGAVLVHRSRDLSRCGLREQGRHDLVTGVFDPHAEIKNTQVLQSTLNVESKVKNGIPEKVSATEEYLYRPFSVGQNGARAKVHTKLTLTGQSGGSDTGTFTESRTIIFENPNGVKSEASNLQNAVQALQDTTKLLQNGANFKSAGEFAQFVRILRVTSKDDLMKLWGQSKKGNLEKRVYLDGLLRAGTGPSIEASIQILRNKELNDFEQRLVYLSLGNAKHVTNEALKAAATLLDVPNIPKEVYLGVGALAGAFCNSNKCHGQGSQSQGIAALSQKLASKLQNCKPKNKIDEDYVVTALKGVRSIRHIEDSLIDRLAQCVTDKNVKPRVKVAALEAFLADPCTAKLKKVATDTMKNRQLDSEIRIKAYLAVIGCPCAKSATEIKNLLESEPVQQVGRFISSSLRHIRSSANPDKQLAKQHYGQIRTPYKFGVDDRKYSFYREASYDIDALGIGGNVEQSVIFSQDSFLPRSASLNVTAELFGHSLNVFEIGGRQGNLDRVVEHFLGPKSFLRTQKPQETYDNLMSKLENLGKTAENKIRHKRGLKQEIDNFDKQVKADSVPYNNELDLDIYVKLFGTDAVFLSLGDDKGFNVDNVLNEILKYVDTGINQAKHFQQDIRAHLLFLDAELAYPTSTGFRLRLDLVGSATARFDLSTNIDFRQIFRDPNNAKVDVKLIPSTDIEISALFLVDADAVATGVKVVNNLHTSTGGHFVAKILENGHGIDIQLGLPVDKQELITASSDLVLISREKGQKEKQWNLKMDWDKHKKEYAECFDQLSGVLGLTFCGELSLPVSVTGQEAQASIQKALARYPLIGPVKLKVHLEKNDLRGYHLKYVYHENNGKYGFEMLFEAEGGQNRKTKVNGELVNREDEKSLLLSLESPLKTAHGQVSLLMKPNEYVALVKAKWDAEEYYAKAGFAVEGNNRRSVFKPIIEYQVPGVDGKKSLKIDGKVIKEQNEKYLKLALEGIKINMPNSNEVVDINGFFENTETKAKIELKAKKGEHNAVLKGESTFANKDYTLELTNTLNPNVNFRLVGMSDNDPSKNHYQNNIEIFYGGDLRSKIQRVSFIQLLKYQPQTQSDEFSIITKNKLNIPQIPIEAEFSVGVDPKKIEIELEGKYQETTVEFEVKGRTNIKTPGDYNIKVEAKALDKGFEIFAKRDIVDEFKSNFENSFSIKDVCKYELSGVVTHKLTNNDVNIGANGHLSLRTGKQQDNVKFEFGFQNNPHIYASNLKVNTNKELINYFVKVNRGANSNGEFKLTVMDEFVTNGQFKVTDNDGKGNGGFIMHFKKADRKFKGDVKFVAKDPVFNADVDLFLNFGKDNNDKIHFSSNNKHTDKLIDSKNHVTYNNQKVEANLKAEGDINSKGNVYTEVVIPTGRIISLKFNRDMKTQGNEAQGEVYIEFADAPKRGSQPSKITFKGKFDSNPDKNIFNYENEFGVHLKDNKNWIQTIVIKNNPVSGKKYKGLFKHDITGTMMPAPYTASGYIEYDMDDNIIDGVEPYQLKVNYGDKFNLNLEGKTDIHLFETGDKKFADDFTVTLKLPFESFHDAKYVSNVLLLVPDNKDELLEFTIVQTVHLNSDQYKVDANGKVGKTSGFTKVKVLVPHNEPFTLDTSYKTKEEGEKTTGDVEVKTTYGKGKSANFHVTGVAYSSHEYSLNVKAVVPQDEKFPKVEFSIHAKNPTPDTYNVNLILDTNGAVSKADATILYSTKTPVVDITYNTPNNKPSKIYFKANQISDTHLKFEVKVDNVQDLNADFKSESQIENGNVLLTSEGNIPKWSLKNFKAKFASKDAGSGKRLEFAVDNDNKNVVSGSTSYISKQEGPKTIIEGSGSVKVENQQKSATFKYIRTILTEGNEQGVETFVNMAIGERSYVTEIRFTNLETKASYVYCEEKKQCAHAEFNSKVNAQDKNFQHLVNIVLDLRKLGINPEFGLQLKNEIDDRYRLVSALNIHLNKDENKYHLQAYNKPRPGDNIGYVSGITLQLPKRTVALESVFGAGSGNNPFPLEAEVSIFMDKNKPQLQQSAKLFVDLTGNEKQHAFKAEFNLHHPSIPQDTGFTVQSNMNHEAMDNFRFEGIVSVTQEGQGKIIFEVKPNTLKFLVDTPIVKMIDLEGTVKFEDNLQEGDLKFSLLQGKPVQMKAVAKDFQYFEFTTGYSEDANRKLSIIGHIETDKRIDISADVILPGSKKNIGHGAIFLKDNLVQTEYGASKENFEYFLNALRGDIDKLQDRVKQLVDKNQADMKSRLDRYTANVDKLRAYYEEEFQKLTRELVSEDLLKDFDKVWADVYHALASIVNDIIKVTSTFADTINKVVTDTWKKVLEIYDKELKSHVEAMYSNMVAIVKEYTDGIIDLIAHLGALVTDFVEKHKAELKELTDAVTGIFKSLTRILIEKLKEFRTISASILQDISQQIKEMPMIAMLKEKLAELVEPQRVIEVIREMYQAVQVVLPTEESKQLAEAIVKYLEKKINKEKVNEEAELRILTEKMANAFSSVINFVKQQLNQFGIPTAFNFDLIPTTFGIAGQSWPSFGGKVSFSFLNEIMTGDIPNPLEFIKAYRPRSFNPFDEIPAKLRGVVVNGQHIFTFDGAHLTFPGTCRYVLAHDHVDRNFSLVIQLQNGQPKVLSLEDESGSIIELKDNGQVVLNGANHGFPVVEKDIIAYKDTKGDIGLVSKYGLVARCTPKLTVCYVEVSGFYLGKLRGLLGDGNNEPYDDFRLPNGKIVTSQAEFGHAYRLAGSCPAVKTPEHHHSQMHASLPPACEKVFGSTSPLWPLSWLLDVAPFRQACIHAVTANEAHAQDEACDLARGYAALASTGLLPVVLPDECVKCTDADKPREVGDTYELKVPAKQADIVILVETTKDNEKVYKDLLVPVVSQVVDSLKQKKIDDVKVYLLGITPKYAYPVVYDTENVKLKGAKIHFDDESRYKPCMETINVNNVKLNEIQEIIADVTNKAVHYLGLTNIVAAYTRSLELPLRAGATKTTISLVSEHCRISNPLLEFTRGTLFSGLFHNYGLTQNLITVTPDLAYTGGKPVEQIIGYDSSSVLLLGDKKKGQNTEQLRSKLTNSPDACIDFVHATHGMIFSATNFGKMNGGQQKQFIQTAGLVIVDRMTKHQHQQTCTCSFVDSFHVRSVCARTGDKDTARRRK